MSTLQTRLATMTKKFVKVDNPVEGEQYEWVDGVPHRIEDCNIGDEVPVLYAPDGMAGHSIFMAWNTDGSSDVTTEVRWENGAGYVEPVSEPQPE